MDELRIEPRVRIGRFFLDDILRATDLQWNLVNTAVRHQMTEPLLAEIMACLHHVGGVLLQCHDSRNGIWVSYDQVGRSNELPGLFRGRMRAALTRKEAQRLISDACSLAKALNEDCFHDYIYQQIFLFGSCLSDKPNPGDVDLAVEIHYRDGQEIPKPSYYIFARNEPFQDAARFLIRRGNGKKVSLHDRRELATIGAPYRLIWTREQGRINGPSITPDRKPELDKTDAAESERGLPGPPLAANWAAVRTRRSALHPAPLSVCRLFDTPQ